MRIIVGANHLDAAKQQAHKLRDNLFSRTIYSSLDTLHTKASFLNIWATCLGYNDWGDFQATTKFGHKNSSSNTIITPDTIDYLASKLCQKSYCHDSQLQYFKDALILSTQEEELQLFHPEDIEWYKKKQGNEAYPLVLELGPQKHTKHLINLLLNDYNGFFETRILHKELLKYAKTKRDEQKGLSKQEIKHAYLDIYPKSGENAENVIEEALKKDWIEEYTNYNRAEQKQMYRLSQRSIDWLFLSLTEDYSPEWLKWNKIVDQIYSDSKDEKALEGYFTRIKAFSKGQSPQEFTDFYIQRINRDSKWDRENGGRLAEVISAITEDIPHYQSGESVFHVKPRLLLDYTELGASSTEDMSVKASLAFFSSDMEQIGDSLNKDVCCFSLSTPYPNKRHVVAIGPSGHEGVFIDIPDKTAHIRCVYVWSDHKRELKLSHILDIPLSNREGNSLFSCHHGDMVSTPTYLGASWPLSFFSLDAVSGSASNIDELKQTKRFQNQVTFYERTDSTVTIKESMQLTACSVARYSHTL